MTERRSIAQLIEEVLNELERMHYAAVSIKHYRENLGRFRAFADSKDKRYLSEDLLKQYLVVRYCYDTGAGCKHSPYVAVQIRAIRMLMDFERSGRFPVRLRSTGKPPSRFGEHYALYIAELESRGLADKTIYTRERDTLILLNYLHSCGLSSLTGLTQDRIEAYLRAQSARQPGGIARVLASLRGFLKAMFANGITPTDLSMHVPPASRYPSKPVQKLWETEEIKRLIGSVERADTVGKRDYAILLLVVRYGMRSRDVLGLRLSDIDWGSMTIRFHQSKTAVPNTLPIVDDVGWALADWIANARPKQAASDHLFTRLTAPYCEMSALGSIVSRRMLSAGLQSNTKGSGAHSLRHALATRMLVGETPFTVISAVLGHSSVTTTTVYLHSDIDGLRQCAMEEKEGSDDC